MSNIHKADELSDLRSRGRFFFAKIKVVTHVTKIYDIVIIEMKSQQSFSLKNPRRKGVAKTVASFCMEKFRFKEGIV